MDRHSSLCRPKVDRHSSLCRPKVDRRLREWTPHSRQVREALRRGLVDRHPLLVEIPMLALKVARRGYRPS